MTTINIDLSVQQPVVEFDIAAGQAVLVPKNSALDLSKVEELVAAAAASETAASEQAQAAQGSAAAASGSAAAAAGSAVNAKASETAALAASQAAQVSAVTVNEAVAVVGGYASAAQTSATTAQEAATNAQASAQASAKSLSDMALMVGARNASDIIDASGVTQQEINDSLEFKKSSLENKTIAQMLVFDNVDFDKDEAITTQVSSPSNRHFKSNGHTLTQTAQRTSILGGGYDKDNITIEGFNFIQDKTSAVSGGTANDHQMSKFYGGKYNRLIGNKYDGQYAISFAYGSASLPDRTGQFGLAAFNEATDLQGMFIESIGSQYNRIIGNALDSVTKGQQHGIRLSGYDKVNNPSESTHAPNFGQVGVANVFRRIANGVSAQNSSKYSNLSAMHFTDVDACIHASLGTVPLNDPSMHRFDFTAHNVRKLANLQYLNHTKLGFHVDGSSFTSVGIDELTGRTGTGFNHYEGMIRNSAATAMINRYSHNLYNLQIDTSNADGAVISGNYGGGTIIANACNTCVSVSGNYNNLTVVATNGVYNALAVSGVGNVINIQTDGNVAVSGNGNTIIGRIGGKLTVTGSDNKFIGEVVGTVSRGSGTGNKYSDLKGWSDTIVMPATTTTGGGRITVTVAKHESAQIRNIFATIPLNANGWTSKVISISGAAVIFDFYDAAGALLNTQPVTFNYAYVCA